MRYLNNGFVIDGNTIKVKEKTSPEIDQPNNNLNKENKKQEYINKLDNIEAGFKDFNDTEKATENIRRDNGIYTIYQLLSPINKRKMP
ncbi:MAG TPA: hypothetical protein DC034_09270 [Clostridium sp.]|uniref:hypothetical protein n=1 Tax=uncultured Clostridium sp. TaxID=59620 RepID=UPI000E8DCB4A|nr:hypothetical protein [uncultured Clostridium sp.]NLU08381.1 hypothetical protein [Clostridiales bacterium]HBC96966.1 hypothetical protein [Clostridium sp.]